jgi:uncharacterized protein (DUF2236 family)
MDGQHRHPVTSASDRTSARPARGASARRINAERLVLLGWSRAILLQFAHPLIAAGVYDHSTFRLHPWAAVQRLRQTVRAMLALTFGEEADAERTIDRIRAVHRRVHGELTRQIGPFAAGTPYSAEDPALVLWVHATLLESVPLFYELLVRPLDESQHDDYCRDAAPVAVALGASAVDVPMSRRALNEYLGRVYSSGEIVVGAQARELGARVIAPFGLLTAPATLLTRLLTVGTLPAEVRRGYDFAWTSRDQRMFEVVAPKMRLLRKLVPRAAATWRPARAAS